jgi:hypothetical protein
MNRLVPERVMGEGDWDVYTQCEPICLPAMLYMATILKLSIGECERDRGIVNKYCNC